MKFLSKFLSIFKTFLLALGIIAAVVGFAIVIASIASSYSSKQETGFDKTTYGTASTTTLPITCNEQEKENARNMISSLLTEISRTDKESYYYVSKLDDIYLLKIESLKDGKIVCFENFHRK